MEINDIINNYIDDNLGIFKKELNKLNKLQLANLIIEWTLQGKAHTEVMNIVQRYLY